MTTFQYFSDVHTEFYMSYPGKIHKLHINPSAPYLILAGDIGIPSNKIYELFLEMISKKFKKIFIVSGNHEYYKLKPNKKRYNDWMTGVDDSIRKIVSKFKNIVFLQNQLYDIENTNLTIFGGTFWSKINPSERVSSVVTDYETIPSFTPIISNTLHDKAVASLSQALIDNPTRDFIVISHHVPQYSLINMRYKYSGYNSAFASDIEISNSPQIKAWFYGHTHIPNESGKFHANPIGYPDENNFKTFDKIIKL